MCCAGCPPLRLTHYGKSEILDLIDQMEEEYDVPFQFTGEESDDPALDTEGGIHSWAPSIEDPRLKKTTWESDQYHCESEWHYRRLVKYLKKAGNYKILKVSLAVTYFFGIMFGGNSTLWR